MMCMSAADAVKKPPSWAPRSRKSTLIGHGRAHSGIARNIRASGPSLSRCAHEPWYDQRMRAAMIARGCHDLSPGWMLLVEVCNCVLVYSQWIILLAIVLYKLPGCESTIIQCTWYT